MPKLKKRSQKRQRENWFLNFFIVGVLFGALFTLIALGRTQASLEMVALMRIVLLLSYLVGWIMTLNYAVRRKALIRPHIDGFISGITLATQTVVWVINGIQFP